MDKNAPFYNQLEQEELKEKELKEKELIQLKGR